MKKSIFLLSLAFIAMYSCRQTAKDSFTINGNIQGLDDPYIYLRWRGGDSTHLDSAAVTEGKFTLQGKAVEPVMASLYLKDYKGYLSFFLENTDIKITGTADSMNNAKITGSPSQDEYEAYKASVKDLTAQREALYKKYSEAGKSKDSVTLAAVEKQLEQLRESRREKTKEFITAHPKSFVSLTQLQRMTYSVPYAELNKLFTGLDTSLQNSLAGNKLAEHLDIMEKTSVGKPALAFTQNNVNGKPVSLSDFKGKYVLIDFWASWCGPCRAENPNVVKAYNKYKSEGFTVLGVSLDTKVERWKKAIEEDDLTWTQVSDLKGWDNAVAQKYGVHAIPTNWLIDPQGKIIGHSLRGADLKNKLAEIFE